MDINVDQDRGTTGDTEALDAALAAAKENLDDLARQYVGLRLANPVADVGDWQRPRDSHPSI